MPLCAAYARYSTDEQRATSIDDQLRRCRELAARHGLSVEDALVFSDSAVTGTSKGDAKRKGYRRLLDAIEARACDVVIADEVSRLTRSTAEGGRLIELVENTGVRFLTFDGIDTHQESWKLLWLFKLTSATQEVDAAAFRTRRGMLGQLERGYQVAQAPYGYRPLKHFTPGGRMLGTTWVIEPTNQSRHCGVGRWIDRGRFCPDGARRSFSSHLEGRRHGFHDRRNERNSGRVSVDQHRRQNLGGAIWYRRLRVDRTGRRRDAPTPFVFVANRPYVPERDRGRWKVDLRHRGRRIQWCPYRGGLDDRARSATPARNCHGPEYRRAR